MLIHEPSLQNGDLRICERFSPNFSTSFCGKKTPTVVSFCVIGAPFFSTGKGNRIILLEQQKSDKQSPAGSSKAFFQSLVFGAGACSRVV